MNPKFLASLTIVSLLISGLAHGQEPTPTIWSNTAEEALAIVTSPLNGSWPTYLAAITTTGLLASALNNDLTWFSSIQQTRNSWQDKVMPPASLLGDGLFHIGSYGLLYQFGNEYDKKVAAMAFEGQINVALYTTLFKFAFSATRPYINLSERSWFTMDLNQKSFPSGHSTTAFCAAAILGHAYNIEWLTFPIAGLVGYSRIYNQQHWPADVIAGAGLGVLIGYTVIAFHKNIDLPAGIHFSTEPLNDGAKLVLTWAY